MKKHIALIVMMTCAFAPIVNAAGPGGGPDRQNQQKWYKSGPNHDDRRAPQQQRDNRPNGNEHASNDRYGKPRGAQEHFSWQGRDYRKGQPAPERFRGERYRVNDWRDRGLYQPPSGHYWTRIDGNYVLIAAATGVITSILLGNVLSH